MNYTESIWQDFRRIDFKFEEKAAIVIFPNSAIKGNKWLFKTAYFGAFPEFEIEMLQKGYALAHIANTTRWCLAEDTERQARFAKFLHKEFGFSKKCMPVGMSCGGMQAIFLGAKHPEVVSAMYLDAPVVNLLSCPCGMGDANDDMFEEFFGHFRLTKSQMINYREHPQDYLDSFLKSKIPVFLVAGDSDKTVPYHENGELVDRFFKEHGLNITTIVKEGCDHHPHGLEDNTPLINFAEKYYK